MKLLLFYVVVIAEAVYGTSTACQERKAYLEKHRDAINIVGSKKFYEYVRLRKLCLAQK